MLALVGRSLFEPAGRRPRGTARLAGVAILGAALALAIPRPFLSCGRLAVSGEAQRVAVERGLSFVRRNRSHLGATSDLSALIVLDYLQRKYALPPDLAFENSYDGASYAERLRTWGRFVGARAPIEESSLGSLDGNPGIEELVVHALYCDTFPLPAGYAALLLRFAERGGYALTHAALSLRILRENGCSLRPDPPGDADERLRRGMLALLERRPPDPQFEELDVRYEALALLEDSFGRGDVPDEQLARVLEEQQPDGGWKAEADHPSRLHPTVLALWALLAHTRRDAPETTFARGKRGT